MRAGQIICTKSITHRDVVEVKEGKSSGKQRITANSYTFNFQPEHSLLSKVGVFLYLGTYAEANGAEKAMAFAKQQLRSLSELWEEPRADDAVDPSATTQESGPRA